MNCDKLGRRSFLQGLMALAGLALTGCGDSNHRTKVAVITKSLQSAFWRSVQAGVNAVANEYNVEYRFDGPDNEEDYMTQELLINQAVEDGFDAIVFSAIDREAASTALEKAAAAGLKIVVIDSDVNSDKVHCRVMTDSYACGQQAGRALLEMTEGPLVVGIVNYESNGANGQQREEGFRSVLEGESRVQIVDAMSTVSSAAAAEETTRAILAEYPEINALFATNELVSLGVGSAVESLGLAEQTTVICFDSNVISVDQLEIGVVDALVVQNPFAMGYLGLESACLLATGHNNVKDQTTAATVITRNTMYHRASQQMLFPFGN